MTALRTDRFLRLIEPPAFLAVLGPRDRMLWRVAIAPVVFAVTALVAGVGSAQAGAWLATQLGGQAVRLGLAGDMMKSSELPYSRCFVDSSLACGGLGLMQFALTTAAMTLALLLTLRLTMGRPMLTWITGAGRIRWRLFLAGLAVAGLVLGLFDVLAAMLPGSRNLPSPLLRPEALLLKLIYLLICLTLLPVAALFEELLCRGWLLQQTAAFTRSLPAILLVNAVIFSALHLDGDMGHNVGRAVSGIVWSYAALRLGGLEFAVGAHAANNILLSLFFSTFQEGDAPHSTALEAGLDVAASLTLLAAVEVLARWRRLAAWAGLTPSATAAPGPSEPEETPEAHP
ncbi:membrane protease YdiL (CAAX protease family) [Caulobacter ginsengisoli]|uniref:Membrane protease YdiL (CAAX protease family) n=1 Tax=Caulobacter ginsengisoli TaxID=400775 RepID=A0ABU0IS04_9CAUL|nr:CPBP family intramembrane glutamic endopeptidase [Caulobacter ginsengisoli]MDQ0464784.1 membrane protease YdiL (CAAX protease family) [Caulobacter ginsengisoli]